MRLICPNCGAQYEVPDDVVPETGRDVQCSNCGHTWFETPGASAAAEDDILTEQITEDVPTETQNDAPDAAPDTETDADPEPEMPELAPAPQRGTPQRPPLDASIAEILREEAAREEASRAAEAQSGLESQGDLGIEDTPQAPPAIPMPVMPRRTPTPADPVEAESQQRMARLRGESEAVEPALTDAGAHSRKELLPDIEEINSTLRSERERDTIDTAPEQAEVAKRKSFRRGFLMMLLVIVVLALIYVFADMIAAQVPALEGALTAYVNSIDAARIWLDVQIDGLIARMEA